MFNLNKKINQVRKYIQSLNLEIKQQFYQPESIIETNDTVEISEQHNEININQTKLDDSQIKLTKRSYALDQFIRKSNIPIPIKTKSKLNQISLQIKFLNINTNSK